MDLAKMEFADASFDAVTCKEGLMFCADPVQAASELRRVLKPNGHFAMSAWDEPEKNAFFMTVNQALSRFMPRPAPRAGSPGPFRLAPMSEFESVLRRAGFTEIKTQTVEVLFEVQSTELHWMIVSDMSAPIEQARANLPPDAVEGLRQEMAAALNPIAMVAGSACRTRRCAFRGDANMLHAHAHHRRSSQSGFLLTLARGARARAARR